MKMESSTMGTARSLDRQRIRPAEQASTGGWETAGALLALWFCALLVTARGLISGELYWEGDTVAYYLPVFAAYQSALDHGGLPLWTPHVFGGQPLFAEGEGGMLYPPNLLLAALLPLGQAYSLALLVRIGLAGSFAFWFARVLGLSHAAALLSGMVFALSSFLVGQMHHPNVADTAIWAPAVLGCADKGLLAKGRRRWAWASAGGVALGCALLGVHVEPALMIGLLLAAWCAFRILSALVYARSTPLSSRLPTLIAMALVGPVVVVLGMGIAAVQLVPLYELSQVATRGQGLSYASASDFAVGVHDLITAVLPFFFRGPGDQWWSLWFQWETTLYIGIAPLALAAFAVVFSRRAEVAFFAVVAVVGVLLAMGDNSPLKLFALIWHTPGLDFLRAPGRFALFVMLSGAMLSGFGLHYLNRLGDTKPPRAAPFFAACLVAAAVLLLIGMTSARTWLSSDPAQALALMQYYVALPHDQSSPIDPEFALRGLHDSLDVLSPGTLWAALIWIGSTLLLVWAVRDAQHRPHARLLLVAVAATDLVLFATSFHHAAPLEFLTRQSPLVHFLLEQPGDYRVLSAGPSPAGVEPNRLLPLAISDASGYSSLAPRRLAEYLKLAGTTENKLLDLLGVRYLLSSQAATSAAAFGGVRYDREHPIRLGAAEPDGTSVSFSVDNGGRATEVRWIGYLVNNRHLPQETQVGTLRVVHARGVVELPLRAGVEIADNGLELPLATPAQHAPIRVAFAEPARTAEGAESRTLRYFATVPLPEPLSVTEVSATFTHADGALHVLGIGVADAAGSVRQLSRAQASAATGGQVVFADKSGSVIERSTPMKPAFLVSQARWLPREAILDTLLAPEFDPRQEVLLEGPPFVVALDNAPLSGSVEIIERTDRRIDLVTTSTIPAILVLADRDSPGWRATVDGADTPIATANYLFRAVPVPPGDHRVTFWYDPQSLKLGAGVSAFALLIAAALMLAPLAHPTDVARRVDRPVDGGPRRSM